MLESEFFSAVITSVTGGILIAIIGFALRTLLKYLQDARERAKESASFQSSQLDLLAELLRQSLEEKERLRELTSSVQVLTELIATRLDESTETEASATQSDRSAGESNESG